MTTASGTFEAVTEHALVRRSTPAGRARASVALVVVSTAAVAALLHLGSAQRLAAFPTDFRIPWWALALAFFAAEHCAIRLDVRRTSHVFTFGALPLVAGLAFATPAALLGGCLLGLGAHLAYRRARPLRVTFSLALAALETAIVLIVAHTMVDGASLFGLEGLSGVLGATVVASIVGVGLGFVVSSLSEGEADPTRLAAGLAVGTVATATSTALALLAVDAIEHRRAFGLLLLVPAIVVLVAYRALVEARERQRRLEFLYETNALLHRSTELETGMLDLLDCARAMFRSEVAEVVLVAPEEAGGIALRTVVGPGAVRVAMQPIELVPGGVVARVLADKRPLRIEADDAHVLELHMPRADLRNALVVPLVGERDVHGTLLVANTLTDRKTAANDATLLETLSQQLGVMLENERLEKSLEHVTNLSQALEHQALHDALTGIANRVLFTQRLEHAVARQARSGALTGVVFVDVDDFKSVNDGLGHDVGDALLLEAAARIGTCLRAIDTPARLGGDEFAVLLEDLGAAYDAELIAQRIVELFREPFVIGNEHVVATASVGVAIATDGESAGTVLGNADVAMYRAKARGKAQFASFEDEMRHETFGPLALRRELEHAIEREELVLHYEPVVSLATGRIEGFEALMRWDSPRRGLVWPSEFLPIAEETGLILEMGRWGLATACLEAERWRVDSGVAPWVSVNISVHQLQTSRLVDEVTGALHTSRLPPYRLVLEVTESIAIIDDGIIGEQLARLRELGVRIALDDFGAGYSSLARLQTMPLDILKIDRELVMPLGGSSSAPLTRTIVHLARSMGLTAVAEGIERPEQLQQLTALGCDLGQGYLFARSLDANGAKALLNRQEYRRWPGLEHAAPASRPHLRAVGGQQ